MQRLRLNMENKNLNAARTPEERVREISAHTAMKPIHIVTGFFDIGRANFDGYERDNETYFAYFRFWARIENDMTVYCASEHAAQVAAIRAEYGLEDRTKIVQVDDPFSRSCIGEWSVPQQTPASRPLAFTEARKTMHLTVISPCSRHGAFQTLRNGQGTTVCWPGWISASTTAA